MTLLNIHPAKIQKPDGEQVIYLLPEGYEIAGPSQYCPVGTLDSDLPAVALRVRRELEAYPYAALEGHISGGEVTVTVRMQPTDADPLPLPVRVEAYLRPMLGSAMFCAFGAPAVPDTTNTAVFDGVATWTVKPEGEAEAWMPVSTLYRSAWNGQVWCAVGSDSIQFSNTGTDSRYALTGTDGLHWTPNLLPVNAKFYDIAWNGFVFCAVSSLQDDSAAGVSIISPDGADWSSHAMPGIFGPGTDPLVENIFGPWYRIAHNGSVFCAVAVETSGYPGWYTITSPDGEDWGDPHYHPMVFDGIEYRVVYANLAASNNGILCASLQMLQVGGTAQNYLMLAVSADNGASWSFHLPPTGFLNINLASNGTIFCLFEGVGHYSATSTDGINWNVHPISVPNPPGTYIDMASDGNLFVAVSEGADGKSVVSEDGASWAFVEMPSGNFHSIAGKR